MWNLNGISTVNGISTFYIQMLLTAKLLKSNLIHKQNLFFRRGTGLNMEIIKSKILMLVKIKEISKNVATVKKSILFIILGQNSKELFSLPNMNI